MKRLRIQRIYTKKEYIVAHQVTDAEERQSAQMQNSIEQVLYQASLTPHGAYLENKAMSAACHNKLIE